MNINILMKKVSLLSIGFILLILAGCSDGTDSLSLRFELHPDAASRTGSRALTNLPQWTKAEARITEIVLDYTGPSGTVSYTEPSTSVVNLLTGVADPELPTFTLGPGTYQSINFGAELLDDGATPSILLEGTWNNEPIRVEFISGEVFEAEAGTLIVEPGTNYEIQVILDPDFWFSSLSDSDLTNAAKDAEGVIVISDNLNGALFDTHFATKVDEATQSVLPGGTPD
jgi:hypothetical protein